MSTTIDERVVEMRFDNRHFEQNVSHTMSTLEKFKKLLHFDGASKGLENVNSAAKNVNMAGLGSAVENVSMKFSALQVMGVTALANITNSAVNAGKRIVSALTIDPVKTGFQEYETQINAVQTILANTQSKGTTIDDVNKALNELNAYADKTIYNFTEMTRNIGTFTAAGVDLETSVSAIQGIANLAAVSGSTSQQASTAMYQLSQALATGTVKLQDWNSVVNAGMGGEVFQNALVRTAAVMAGASDNVEAWRKKNIDSYGSFRDSLTQGEWLTTEVLTNTLNQFTMAAEEGSKEWEAYKKSLMETGYTEKQAEEILKMANTATDAATKVKTFTQLWDVLKESAQSGWSQTWKLIIGDFEEAKSLLTPLADFLTGFINRMSDFRNAILESALGRTFTGLSDKINSIVKPAAKVTKTIKGTVETITDLGEIANKVIHGDFGNGKERFDALTEAGVNYYKVQNKVNEKLGSTYRHSEELIASQDKLLGAQNKSAEATEKNAKSTEKQAEATVKLTDEQKKQLKDLGKMSEEQLRAAGYTEKQIAALKDLAKTAEELGLPFDEFIDQMDQINGRWLLMNSFKNIGQGLVDVGKAIGQAWKDVFPEHNIENFANKLFDLLYAFNKFTVGFTEVFYTKVGENKAGEAIYELTDAGEKLVRTFQGVFAIVDVVTTLVGGGFKIAFKVITELLSRFDLNILDVTAAVGDALVKFRDWIDSILNISGAVDFLVPLIKSAAEFIGDLINAVKESKWFADFCDHINTAAEGLSNLFASIPDTTAFQNLIAILTDAGTAIKEWIETLKGSENIPADIIAGLASGIRNGVPEILSAVFDLAKSIISGICSVLGIHSPSTVMIAIGGFIIAGLVKGILDGETTLTDSINAIAEVVWTSVQSAFNFIKKNVSGIFKGLWDFLTDESGNVQWGKIFAGGMMGTLLWVLVQFANAFKGITDSIGGIGDILEEAGDTLKKFGKVLDGYSWDLKAKALQKLAISIAILVAAIWVLTTIEDPWKLVGAVAVIGILAGVLVGLAWAIDKFGAASASIGKDGAKLEGLKTGLLQIALCIGVLALVVKMIGSMERDEAIKGFIGLGVIAVGLVGFMAALGGITRYSKDVKQFGSVMLKLAIAMMLMVTVVKLVAGLDAEEIVNGIIFAAAFAIFVNSITKVAKSAGNNVGKVGGMILKLTIAMALMVGVVKLASMLSPGEMLKGAAFAAGFVVFVRWLVKCTKIGKKQQLANLSGLVMSISFSLMLMVGVCKLVGMLSIEEMLKGAAFVAGFTVLLKYMVKILTIGNEQKMAKVGATILAMSVAIGILAAVSFALGYVNLASLAKGVTAVSILCYMMSLMVKGLKGAQNVQGTIMMMAIAIGVMTAAIVALTFIDDTSKLMAAAASLAIVMGMFALIEKNAKKINKSIGAIAIMSVAVGLLASILYLLTNNIDDADAAVKVAVSLGILMGALAISLKMMSGLAATSWSAVPAMLSMLVIIAGLATILGVMDKLDVNPSIETATALSILLLAMAGVTAVLTLVGAGAPAAIAGAGAFVGVVAIIGAFMLALAGLNKLFPKMQEWLDTGIDILQKIGEGIGRFIGGFLGGIGEGLMDSLLDMTETFVEVMRTLGTAGVIGGTIKTENFDAVLKLIDILGEIALATVGTSLSDIFTLGGTSMEKFETDGVAFFKAMKAIGEASTNVTIDEAGVDAVIGAAQKFADLQSSLEPIGGVISWFTGRDDLAKFGTNVGEFISSMVTALSGLNGVTLDSAGLDAVVYSTRKMAELQSSLEPIGGVITWFTGRDDLATFGVNVGEFITSMKTALSGLTGFSFDSEALGPVVTAAQSLADLQSSLEPIGGVISWFNGRDDLGTFGVNVGAFITSMKTALANLEGTTLDETALKSVIKAAGDLADFQEKLEPMGSVITWFTGRTDLGTFGINIGLFADAMGKLKSAVGENGMTEEVIASITNAGNAIIELQNVLPEETWFDGKMNLSEFSEYISEFGTAMGDFAKTASGIDTAAVNTTMNTAYKIKNLITSLVDLDTSGLAAFTGVGTGGFGADGAAYKIAQAMSAYSKKVAGIDVSAVSTSATVAAKLKNLIASLVGLDTSGIENFKIDSIGSAMKSYASKVKGLDGSTVSQSISAANRLKTFISGLSGFDGSGVGAFKTAVNELSTVKISGIVKAFSGASTKLFTAASQMMDGLVRGMRSKTTAINAAITTILTTMSTGITSKSQLFEKSGVMLATKLATGISKKKDAAKTAIVSCVSSAANAIRIHYSSFVSSGIYLGSGLVMGINSKRSAAYWAGYTLGQMAVQGEKDGQASNSPSKLTIQSGKWFGEGLVIGIKKMGSKVYNAGHDLGDTAVKSLSSTVSRIATAIDSDIDVQPTIRPVLDLSDVRSGSGAIADMLGAGSSVGVLSNVGSISAMMNRRGQNGVNDDVVSAIDKLRKDLGNMEHSNYTINGVTVGDDEEVANAFKTIIKAAQVGRRR